MLKPKPSFLNFAVDHMTFLVEPAMYNAAYAIFRIIFGVRRQDIIYEKRKRWNENGEESSMTFAAKIGEGTVSNSVLEKTIIAVVQPSEPVGQKSHVREILKNRGGSVHWQHIALRTPDLPAFHKHALEHGVQFITPIMKDAEEDLIQVFSGEWILPGARPSGTFFEFVQRNPTPSLLKKLEESNRQSWFRDKTFLGLYQEKESEYQSGKVTPFLDDALFHKIEQKLKTRKLWEISEEDLEQIAQTMREYAKPAQLTR